VTTFGGNAICDADVGTALRACALPVCYILVILTRHAREETGRFFGSVFAGYASGNRKRQFVYRSVAITGSSAVADDGATA
jgi:hypothetical protein